MIARLQEQQLNKMNKKLKKAAKQARQHHKKRRIITSVLVWTLTLVVSLALVTVVGVTIFVLSGRSKLLDRTRGQAPDLALEEMSGEMSDGEGESSYVWKEGWVRYNDKIYKYNDRIMTFLVMGIDKRTPVEAAKDATDGGQADGLFLVVANPDEKDVKIIAINRDTVVDIYRLGFEDENGATPVVKGQITIQHSFGDGLEQSCEATVDAVSKLFYNLPISGYVSINMGAVEDLVWAVDGVDLEILEDMTTLSPNWTEGAYAHLYGTDAYDYVHYRDVTVYESARNRLARQKQFLSIYINKLKERAKEDITILVRLYSLLNKYMVTDITTNEVAYLTIQLIDYDFDGENIYTMEGTTITADQFEEFYPDQEALQDLMIQVFYREVDPKGSDN